MSETTTKNDLNDGVAIPDERMVLIGFVMRRS